MTEEQKIWTVNSGEKKVGTVYQVDKGYIFAHQGQTDYFNSKKKLTDYLDGLGKTQLIPFPTRIKHKEESDIFGFKVEGKTYNHLLHVKHRAPVFTKEPNSKCFYAAGWYAICIDGEWAVEYCPKLLVINRNQYYGPYKNESDAIQAAG